MKLQILKSKSINIVYLLEYTDLLYVSVVLLLYAVHWFVKNTQHFHCFFSLMLKLGNKFNYWMKMFLWNHHSIMLSILLLKIRILMYLKKCSHVSPWEKKVHRFQRQWKNLTLCTVYCLPPVEHGLYIST